MPAPPPDLDVSRTQGLVFGHLALILTRLAAYLPPHEAPLLREISNAFGVLEAQHRMLEEEVGQLRIMKEGWHQRRSAPSHSQAQPERPDDERMLSRISTTDDPNYASSDTDSKRIRAYRKAVQERNEKIAQLRQEKEEALRQINAAHKERLRDSESRAQSLEVRAERESTEIQQLTNLALFMQKNLESLHAQVTTLTAENMELKLQREAAGAFTAASTSMPNALSTHTIKALNAPGVKTAATEAPQKGPRSAVRKATAHAAGRGANKVASHMIGVGDMDEIDDGSDNRDPFRWDGSDEDGGEPPDENSQAAVNTHPLALGTTEYSSGEDDRVFDYNDVTVLDEGESEEEDKEEGGAEGGTEDAGPPPAPRRKAFGGKGKASSASYFKLSATTPSVATERETKTLVASRTRRSGRHPVPVPLTKLQGQGQSPRVCATNDLPVRVDVSRKSSMSSSLPPGVRRGEAGAVNGGVDQPEGRKRWKPPQKATQVHAQRAEENPFLADSRDRNGQRAVLMDQGRGYMGRSTDPEVCENSQEEGATIRWSSKGSSTGSRLSLDELLASLGLRE